MGAAIFRGFSLICYVLSPIMSSEMSWLYRVFVWHCSACRDGSTIEKESIAPIPAETWRGKWLERMASNRGERDVIVIMQMGCEMWRQTANKVHVLSDVGSDWKPTHNPEGQHDDNLNLCHRLETTNGCDVALKSVHLPVTLPSIMLAKAWQKISWARVVRLCSQQHSHSLRLRVTYDMYNHQSALLNPPNHFYQHN